MDFIEFPVRSYRAMACESSILYCACYFNLSQWKSVILLMTFAFIFYSHFLFANICRNCAFSFIHALNIFTDYVIALVLIVITFVE